MALEPEKHPEGDDAQTPEKPPHHTITPQHHVPLLIDDSTPFFTAPTQRAGARHLGCIRLEHQHLAALCAHHQAAERQRLVDGLAAGGHARDDGGRGQRLAAAALCKGQLAVDILQGQKVQRPGGVVGAVEQSVRRCVRWEQSVLAGGAAEQSVHTCVMRSK